MRYTGMAVGIALLLLSGCGATERAEVPDVRGERLDVAERHLEDAGLDAEPIGGGTFGIVVRSNWVVCDQEPEPGEEASRVRLIVDRSCPSPPVAARHVVPSLYGEDLDDAEELLAARAISYSAVDRDGVGVPVVDDLWEVCEHEPGAGAVATHVVLYVEHVCDD
jgi:beta-lactam-binding protein with PASTA domain